MTQPFDNAGDGLRAAPAPGTTTAGSRAAGGTGPGVPLSIWPGLPGRREAGDGLPCCGPVTTAVAHRVIDAFSRPRDLVAALGGLPAGLRAPAPPPPGGPPRRPAGRPPPPPRAPGRLSPRHPARARAGRARARPAPAPPGSGPDVPGGSPVHDALLVFTKPGGEARS